MSVERKWFDFSSFLSFSYLNKFAHTVWISFSSRFSSRTQHWLISRSFRHLTYFLLLAEHSVCWLPFISFLRPSIQSEGKSIALIYLGLPSYPSFLSSRIALFFNLQLTLPRSARLNVLLSYSSSSSSSSCSSGHPLFFFFPPASPTTNQSKSRCYLKSWRLFGTSASKTMK